MQKERSDKEVYLWSISIGLGLSLITFVSNWLGLIHKGESLTVYQLFDISFYYFTPLVSWALLTIIAMRFLEHWIRRKGSLKGKILKLVSIVILLSPFVRVFDILVDFSLKNLFGLMHESPFKILNDVWLVVVFSSPTAAFKILVIISIVYFLKRQINQSTKLTLRTTDGAYHVIAINIIMYMQADGNYLNLKTNEGTFRIRNTLKSLEPSLGNHFFRIHKSTIVNSSFIKQLKHWRNGEYLLVMVDEKPLTSSKSYKSSIDEIKNQLSTTDGVESHPNSATIHPTLV